MKIEPDKAEEIILSNITQKFDVELKVRENLKNFYDLFLKVLRSTINSYNDILKERINTNYFDLKQSSLHFELIFGEDIIFFIFKDYIFKIEESLPIWQSSYLLDNPLNAYVGIVDVYNFLKHSYYEDRREDLGYLICRIFINRENHLYVEGKRQLSVLFNDFAKQKVNQELVKKIIESIILYSLNFETLVPRYEEVSIINIEQLKLLLTKSKYIPAKRLGFQFYKNDTNV